MSAVDAAGGKAIALGFEMLYTVSADKKANGPDVDSAQAVLSTSTGVTAPGLHEYYHDSRHGAQPLAKVAAPFCISERKPDGN